MVRNVPLALLATAAVVFANAAAHAGSLDSYNSSATPVVSAPAPVPAIQPYYAPTPTPVAVEAPRDGYYDPARGSNSDFDYEQSFACGGALDGAKCLVILNDHMRRVRLERNAGTILVGNPTIADVTVLGKDTIFVSARSIGSTNIIVLDEDNNEITTFEVFVREPKTKRVVLRNAGAAENYQCAPDCLRALTQSDSAVPYGAAAGQVSRDIGLDQQAIGLQTGDNPNQDPSAGGGGAPLGNAPSAGSAPALGGATETLGALLGGGGSAPVNTAPPPALPN